METASQPVAVSAFKRSHMLATMGPLMVDQAIRNAIQHCWMLLPERERSVERVEQEFRRIVDRAMANLKEDAAAFGFDATSTE